MARAPRTRRALSAALGLACVVGATNLAAARPAIAAEGTILVAPGTERIADSYIVTYRDGVQAVGMDVAARYGATVTHTYTAALHGFAAKMTEQQARRLATDPRVARVEADGVAHIVGTQTPTPSWGLDRIDQRDLPLNNSYTYPNTGSGVRVYIIDTGIRVTHQDFGGRAVWGANFTDDGDNTDCHGHGTHVAGTVAGSSHGVAKGADLTAVKVLDCEGFGSFSSVLAGVDWVTNDHDANENAVANMSLGGLGTSDSLEDAVRRSIAEGVTYVLAAGNEDLNACYFTPARTPEAITVGATDNADARARFSNIGPCLDLFAPGVDIASAFNTSDTATLTASGTSMAAPHAAGVAALIKAANPTFTPQYVRDKMVADSTPNKIADPDPDPDLGFPNRLLHLVNATSTNPTVMNPGNQNSTVGQSASLLMAAHSGTKPYTWSATGLPTGTSINSATGLISGTFSATGTYNVTVTSTNSGGSSSGRISFTWTVRTPCNPATNGTDVAIPDMSTVYSNIAINCSGSASPVSTVEVHIKHTWRLDLIVSLIAPDGSTYVVYNRADHNGPDIDKTFTVDVSSETRSGTWRLKVQDMGPPDVGIIDTWTLTL